MASTVIVLRQYFAAAARRHIPTFILMVALWLLAMLLSPARLSIAYSLFTAVAWGVFTVYVVAPLLFLFVVYTHAKRADTPLSTYVGTDAFRANLENSVSTIEVRWKRSV